MEEVGTGLGEVFTDLLEIAARATKIVHEKMGIQIKGKCLLFQLKYLARWNTLKEEQDLLD